MAFFRSDKQFSRNFQFSQLILVPGGIIAENGRAYLCCFPRAWWGDYACLVLAGPRDKWGAGVRGVITLAWCLLVLGTNGGLVYVV